MILKQLSYKKDKPIDKGYANKTLFLDLSTNEIIMKNVTPEMKEKFIGGKGFNLWLMWHGMPNRVVKWDDPENEICIASGPLGGNTFIPGSGKSIVTTISPLTGMIIDSNVGGYFGPYLKYCGFDALEIQGKSEDDIIIFIDGENNLIKIETVDDKLPEFSHELTQHLTRKYASGETGKEKQKVSVITTGPAAEHTRWGCLNFSWYSNRRNWASSKQAGRGGIGTVFRNKKIRAIVCRAPSFDVNSNNAADLETAKKVGKQHNKEIINNDPIQNEMRTVGTGHLPEIMNKFDLLPTENYRYGAKVGSNDEDFPFNREIWRKVFVDTNGNDNCWYGCSLSCSHYCRDHVVLTGPLKGENVIVDGPEYETIAGLGSNLGIWDPKWIIEGNFYCDTYGLDTISVGTGIAFVMECFEEGIINTKITGGLKLNFGNAEAVLELIHQMARGEGFGLIVGQGIKRMKKIFTNEYGGDPQFIQDIGMEHKGLEFSEYVTKESLAQQGGYGLTLKGPQHDEAWLIFEDIVRGSIPTFEDKARALCWFPYWRTWFSLNGLCKLPWNDVVPMDNGEYPITDPATGNLIRSTIPKHVKWYSEYFTAVTGRKVSPDDLVKMSERVYNFQRIFNIRQGKGLRINDANLPYRAMGPVTVKEYESRQERYDSQLKDEIGIDIQDKSTMEKLVILKEYRQEQYKKLQDAVYKARGWNENGCPTVKKVRDLQINMDSILEVIKPYQNKST
ncbi:MAG: aldehyde ferredoxin oxidoreductase family protein [Promethearchaeota archaeon]